MADAVAPGQQLLLWYRVVHIEMAMHDARGKYGMPVLAKLIVPLSSRTCIVLNQCHDRNIFRGNATAGDGRLMQHADFVVFKTISFKLARAVKSAKTDQLYWRQSKNE